MKINSARYSGIRVRTRQQQPRTTAVDANGHTTPRTPIEAVAVSARWPGQRDLMVRFRSSGQLKDLTWRRHMSYLPMAIIAMVGGMAVLAAMYVRHELRPVPRKLPVRVRGRRVAPGDECFCGGIIGTTGLTSARFGDLLRCTDCNRSWTMDGRPLIRRSRQRANRSMPGTRLDSSGRVR